MKFKKLLLIAVGSLMVVPLLAIISVRIGQNRIDIKYSAVNFEDLPYEIKSEYEKYYLMYGDSVYNPSVIISTDSTIKVQLKSDATIVNLPKLILKGFIHEIYISDDKFILKANKGMPFITNGEILVHPNSFRVNYNNLQTMNFRTYHVNSKK